MKVKVLVKFKDKHTGKIHKVDDVLTINEERLAEIQSVDAGLVEVIKEKPKNTASAKKADIAEK